jgi:hypothetical protein
MAMGVHRRCFLVTAAAFLAFLQVASSVELTFELVDNAKDCFFEFISQNTSANLEFQVVTGGAYDVDVTLESPDRRVLYRKVKASMDVFNFVAPVTGDYAACFSNQFSTFSHKLVYMEFTVGEEPPLPGLDEHVTVMTQMETSAETVHKHLTSVSDYQTHHKLRESQGRKRAEDLNSKVFWLSLLEMVVLLAVGISQVCIVRKFFSEKKPVTYTRF